MLQVTEVGERFYFDWYQGFHGDMYVKAMRDLMKKAGMTGAKLERVEQAVSAILDTHKSECCLFITEGDRLMSS